MIVDGFVSRTFPFGVSWTTRGMSMEMSRLTRDGTAEHVSRDQILRHARGQGNINFPCSADHEQDWQPYPVDPYSAICDDHTYIHTWSPDRFGLIFLFRLGL